MWMKVMNMFSLIWLVRVNEGYERVQFNLIGSCVNEGNECVQFNLIGSCEWR